jgi:nucleoside-diphosphate-sugar epimerase
MKAAFVTGCMGFVGSNISKKLIDEGRSQKQALAIALSEASKAKKRARRKPKQK